MWLRNRAGNYLCRLGIVEVEERFWMNESDGTRQYFVLEGEGGGHKHEVEHEHGYAQQLWHLPAGEQDAEEDEEEHGEQEDDGAAQALAAHRHRVQVVHQRKQEPRERQPNRAVVF